MMTFYVLFVRDLANNTSYTKVYSVMMEAYNEMNRIKNSSGNNIFVNVSRHSFKTRSIKFNELNNEYFKQHGEYAY